MNVSELATALHEQADELDTAQAAPALPAVLARVGVVKRRRRRTVATIGSVALAAAVALAVVLPKRGDPGPEPVRPPHDAIVFPAHVGGYDLVQAQVGRPGQTPMTLTLAKPSAAFMIVPQCSAPEKRRDTRLVVNDQHVGGASCLPDLVDLSALRTPPGFSFHDLRLSGVDFHGRALTISLTLVEGRFSGKPVTDADTQIGFAVYERAG